MEKITILFSSGGRRNQLIGCFRHDAAKLGLSLRVLVADVRPELSSACQLADASFAVPRCTDAGFVSAMLDICQRAKVDLLVPTIDPELAFLSRRTAEFAAIGTRVVISAPEVVALASDKLATAERLAIAGIPTPMTCLLDDYLRAPDRLPWPVIAKPNSGSASQGIVRPREVAELMHLEGQSGVIVQELRQGREYTVNVFFDHNGKFRCAVPHERLEVRAGEVSKGRTERNKELCLLARNLAACLPGAVGPLCFQAILSPSGDLAVFEINARFGGGYPLAHRVGGCFSQWLLEESAGLPSTANDEWKEGVTMLRYDEAVFTGEK